METSSHKLLLRSRQKIREEGLCNIFNRTADGRMLLAIEERLVFDSLSLLLSFVLFSCVKCFPVTRMFGVSKRGGVRSLV